MTEPQDVMGDIVAALAALARGDEDGARAVMDHADHAAAAGMLLGILCTLGPVAAGSPAQWSAVLAAWRPGQRLGEGLP